MRARALLTRDVSLNISGPSFVRGAAIASLFVFAFFPVMAGLVFDWLTHEEYSHGFLVPVISGYLLWRRRRDLHASSAPSGAGFGLLSFGLAVLLLGFAVGEEFLQRLSLPLTLIGLVYFLAGKTTARTCLFPIGYLLLMIPIPYTVYKAIAFQLRLFDAKLVASVSSFLGIPVFREGYLLHLPRITLEVSDACSGTLSIVALLALGTLYIGQTKMGLKRQASLWLMMIPISVLANVSRIVTIVLLVYYSGNWVLDTTFHKLSGTFNFVLGFAVIVLIGGMMSRIPGGRKDQA